MFTRVLSNLGLQKSFCKFSARNGPYNPYRFKPYIVNTNNISTSEANKVIEAAFREAPLPVRNVRHINPVRQSGPLPVYDGPHTMEDIRNIWFNTSCGRHGSYSPAMDPEEVMRRVPGITRKEVEKILRCGLTPPEQVDFAYLVYNLGLDVFYEGNMVFVARQVVTNSKGEKVEILWSHQVSEDLALLPVGFAPINETTDYQWEIFLWGDPMIKPTGELDLGVPNTWFEYEQEWMGEAVGIEDQFNLPEDMRHFPSPKHPNCSAELWRSQDALEEQHEMQDENWYPKDTKYNIYQQKDFISPKKDKSITQNIKY